MRLDFDLKEFLLLWVVTVQTFLKIAQAGWQTWDLFGFRLFSLSKAAPQTTWLLCPYNQSTNLRLLSYLLLSCPHALLSYA